MTRLRDKPSPRRWPVQEAKAKFSALLDASIADGPQIVTKRGVDAAVLVRAEEWSRVQAASRLTLKELLLAGPPGPDLLLPERGRFRRRQPPDLA